MCGEGIRARGPGFRFQEFSMLKSIAFRSRMPAGLLLAAVMVGVLAGCGGGGGGGSAEPEPQKPALSLSWQGTGFATPEVIVPGQTPRTVSPGYFGDVAVTPGGGVHLAWREYAGIWSGRNPYVSRSHDGGATWGGLAIDTTSRAFSFLTTLASGRLVAGSTIDFPQYWWYSPRIWWSDDDGVTWNFQDVQSDIAAPVEGGAVFSHVEEPQGVVEHNGKVIVWMRTDSQLLQGGEEVRNRLYYWDAASATLTRLPIAPPQPGPLPLQADYEIAAMAADPNGYLYVAIAGEVFRTVDGLAWEALPRAQSDANVVHLTVLADGTLAAGLDNYANVYFFKDGSGWRQSLLPGDQEHLTYQNVKMTRAPSVEQIMELRSGALLASAWQYAYASCDGGANWERVAQAPESLYYQPNRMTQAPDGTVWGSFNQSHPGSQGTADYHGLLLKIQPPAGVAAHDFVKCP
jgi:hypothetical protein